MIWRSKCFFVYLIPGRIGIWKCWFLGKGENRSTRRKTSRSKEENQLNPHMALTPGYEPGPHSGRRQLQPDVTSWFVQYCACSCSPHCRRAPVGDVKLVCLALWQEREYLTFISIRFVAFCNQNFADYRSWIILVFFESYFKLDFQAVLSKLTSL